MQLADAYSQAATNLSAVADELATNRNAADHAAAALRNTLAVLEQLDGLEPSPNVRAQLRRLHTDLQSAGTLTPDRVREIAKALGKVAQNNAQFAAQVKNIWRQ
ncbi:hypothetical protein KL864_35385 [Mycolicibacterium goodii]|uniref:hypothetical protein n=1 Tax=Mycolicibacterium goodii TaxID=134601 RepID=UPI001BDC0683|nr:hypothetical protein [Mycolicibacterium goodii]MBU8821140.1 hypothetical protein [Mycolicibacterium goodii]